MDPGDHPSFVNRFEPLTLLAGAEHGDHAMSGSAPRSRRASASRSMSPAPSPRSIISATAAPAGMSSPARTTRRRSISARRARRARPALRDRDRVRRRGARPLGFLGRRRDRCRQGDRHLPRQLQDTAARSQRPVLFGEGPAQHRAVAARPSGHHPGRRLVARAGAFGPFGRPGVLRGQRRQGLGQGSLRQPEAARGQAWPGAATSCRSCLA